MNPALLQCSGWRKLLEGALGKIDVVWAAACALVDDAGQNAAFFVLGVAKLNKFSARGTAFPTSHDGTDVVTVVGVPLSVAALWVLQVIRGVPSDLAVFQPHLQDRKLD